MFSTAFQYSNFKFQNLKKSGDNFIGEIFRILIKRNNDNGHQEHTSLILKIAPRNLIRRQKANSRDIFLREIQMYSEVCSVASI